MFLPILKNKPCRLKNHCRKRLWENGCAWDTTKQPDIGGWCPSHSISAQIYLRVGWVLPDRNSGWNVPRAPFTMHSWRTMAPLAWGVFGARENDWPSVFHCAMYPTFWFFFVTLNKMDVYQQPKMPTDLQKVKSCDVSLFFLCDGKRFPKNPWNNEWCR